MKLEGGCYCGKVRYVADGDPMMKAQCHCRECQYITGGSPNMFIAMPVVLYQVWQFVAPGLYKREKRLAIPLLISSILLFYSGIAFAYFIVFKVMFGFFVGVTPTGVNMTPDISAYLSFVLGIFLAFGTDEGPVFDPRYVTGVAEGEKTVRPQCRIEAFEGAGFDELRAQALVFLIAAIAPVDGGRFGQRGHFGHPRDQARVLDIGWHIQAEAFHRGLVH